MVSGKLRFYLQIKLLREDFEHQYSHLQDVVILVNRHLTSEAAAAYQLS